MIKRLLIICMIVCLCILAVYSYDGYTINSDTIPFSGDEYTYVGYDVMPLYTLDNGTTPISSGLRSVMSGIIGNYSPVIVQYQYTNGTNTQYLREILPDYEWMFNFGLFSLVLYCVFRLGGAVLCRL